MVPFYSHGLSSLSDQRVDASRRVRAAITEHYRVVKEKLLALDHFPFHVALLDNRRTQLEHQLDVLAHETRQETLARLHAEHRQ